MMRKVGAVSPRPFLLAGFVRLWLLLVTMLSLQDLTINCPATRINGQWRSIRIGSAITLGKSSEYKNHRCNAACWGVACRRARACRRANLRPRLRPRW